MAASPGSQKLLPCLVINRRNQSARWPLRKPAGSQGPKPCLRKTIVWVDLAADVAVAVVEIAASIFTGGASIAASGVQSMVDVGSGGMLLCGYRRSRQGPDRVKPQSRKGFKDAVRTSERDVAFASARGPDRAARESGEDSSSR
jgi:hypothetical protein